MNCLFSILLIVGVMYRIWSVEIVQEDPISLSIASISYEEDESDIPDAIYKDTKQALSSLSDIFAKAKEISHSKGGYQDNKEDGNVRRSIFNKATVASESEVMKAILQILDSDEEKLQLLEQMEYLVHQYDVAVNFANMGGMKIITPLLFSSDDKIVSTVALVLGAAMQSNPVVQKVAITQNVGKNLLKQLSHKSPVVLSRILFALSSFLRNAPDAQKEFLLSDGVFKLKDVLKNPSITTDTKMKIVNLFNDLAVEHETAEYYQTEGNTEKITALQRSFAKEIRRCEICKHVASFLSFEDYDTLQKTVAAMLSLNQVCHEDFNSKAIRDRLKNLLTIYQPSSTYSDADEELKRSLYLELEDLILKLADNSSNTANKYSVKLEL